MYRKQHNGQFSIEDFHLPFDGTYDPEKQRLGLTNEETVFQIQENAYMQFILGFHGYSIHVPFDTSRMVHFR